MTPGTYLWVTQIAFPTPGSFLAQLLLVPNQGMRAVFSVQSEGT